MLGGYGGPTSALALKIANLEQILAASPSGFAVGSQISIADFAIFYVVESLTRRMLEVASGPAAVELLLGDKFKRMAAPVVRPSNQGRLGSLRNTLMA